MDIQTVKDKDATVTQRSRWGAYDVERRAFAVHRQFEQCRPEITYAYVRKRYDAFHVISSSTAMSRFRTFENKNMNEVYIIVEDPHTATMMSLTCSFQSCFCIYYFGY
jgi:hypothetical protein